MANPFRIITLCSFVFGLLGAAANPTQKSENFRVTAILKYPSTLAITIVNESDKEVVLYSPNLDRQGINLILAYGADAVVTEDFVPSHPVFSEIRIPSSEGRTVLIDLEKRFAPLAKIRSEHCVFVYWGLIVYERTQSTKSVYSGATVLDRNVCEGH